MSDNDSAVVFHEVGHAVIAVHYGLEFNGVSIERKGNEEGRFSTKGPYPWTEFYSECQAERRHACKQHYQIAIAGAETVVMFFPDRKLLGDKGDKLMADCCLKELSDSETERKEYAERLTDETRSLLQTYRPAIKAVAAALIEHRELGSECVGALVRKAMDSRR